MPTSVSTQTSDRSLASVGFWKPSSMMMRLDALLEEEPGASRPVAADDRRRRGGKEQRFVADEGGVVDGRVDEERPLRRAAIARGEEARLQAAPPRDLRQREGCRGLAGAADDDSCRRRRPRPADGSAVSGACAATPTIPRRARSARGGAPTGRFPSATRRQAPSPRRSGLRRQGKRPRAVPEEGLERRHRPLERP